MINKQTLILVLFCLLKINNANNVTTTVDIITTHSPKLSNNYSRITTIIYISLYALILFVIGLTVKIKSGLKLCSKKYFKALWIQKGIYFAILIHIYDTATDIGVLIDWYFLWDNERKGFNYENIDMKVFFWCGIASLILYKILNILMSRGDSDKPITMIILAFFELSILVFVYDSFKEIQPKINKYYEIEKRRKKLKSDTKDKVENEIELQTKTNTNNTDNKTDNKPTEEKTETLTEATSVEELDEEMTKIIQDIKPSQGQFDIQVLEGIFESMPQVLLQGVFLLRSYNTALSQDSNLILIVTSLIASVVSISTKIITADTDSLSQEGLLLSKYHGCKLKLICIDNECSFNGCNKWYFIRVLGRIFHVLNRFIIRVGGIIFAIYVGVSILYNIGVMWYINKNIGEAFFEGIINLLIVVELSPEFLLIIITKCIDHLIILILILLFTVQNIECDICPDICFRSLNNKNNCYMNFERNDLLFVFIISSWIVYILDIFFTIIVIKLKPNLFRKDTD